MKDWLTYIIASIIGVSLYYILPSTSTMTAVTESLSGIVLNVGIYVLIPFTFFTMTAGAASLRRERRFFPALLATGMWVVVSTFIITAVGALTTRYLMPAQIPLQIESAGFPDITIMKGSDILASILKTNVITVFVENSTFLIPIIIFSLLLGIVLKPDFEYIHPAYTVMNSFAEVFYRFAHVISRLLALGMIILSSMWFMQYIEVKEYVFQGLQFFLLLGSTFGIIVLIILPILALFIGQERHPYRWILGLFAPILAVWFSGNQQFALTTLIVHTRQNLGTAKRITSTTTPILTLFAHGGSAAVSVITIAALYHTVTGAPMTTSALIPISMFCMAFSLLASFTPGLEVPLIIVLTLKATGLGLESSLPYIVLLLPFLQSIALTLDTIITGFGSGILGHMFKANAPIKIKNFY